MITKLIVLATLLPMIVVAEEKAIDKSVVDSLDIDRYMGTWYEIARFDNWFERGMDYVTAEYIMSDDGKISVLNSGIKEGATRKKVAKGRVRRPNIEEPSRLQVAFFLWFWGDYWVMELDPKEYSYAVVGSSNDNFLWILSRERYMNPQTVEMLVDRLRKRGYDTTKLTYVKQ